MPIIGAFILPHGSIILDPYKKDIPSHIQELHRIMNDIGKIIEKMNPDLIFLLTPHGIALSHDYGLYANEKAAGTAMWDGNYDNYSIEVNLDQEQTKNFYLYLTEKHFPVTMITSFTRNVSIPLRWGEVVPLWFLKSIKAKYLIMSLPTRRYTETSEMIPELLNLGKEWNIYFNKLVQKIIIIISADLAHTHLDIGPYGYSDKAETFDELIEKWVSNLDEEILTKNANEILSQALCCGFTGFIVLQGLLKEISLVPKLLIRKTPTYYGMLVASFT